MLYPRISTGLGPSPQLSTAEKERVRAALCTHYFFISYFRAAVISHIAAPCHIRQYYLLVLKCTVAFFWVRIASCWLFHSHFLFRALWFFIIAWVRWWLAKISSIFSPLAKISAFRQDETLAGAISFSSGFRFAYRGKLIGPAPTLYMLSLRHTCFYRWWPAMILMMPPFSPAWPELLLWFSARHQAPATKVTAPPSRQPHAYLLPLTSRELCHFSRWGAERFLARFQKCRASMSKAVPVKWFHVVLASHTPERLSDRFSSAELHAFSPIFSSMPYWVISLWF